MVHPPTGPRRRLPDTRAPTEVPIRLAVLGAGYVGLVTAASLAERGHSTVLVEADPGRLATLRAGRLPFHEPGLAALLAATADRLHLTDDPARIAEAEVVLLALPTPAAPDGRADCSALFAAVPALASHLHPDAVVVVKSTVPPGTTDALAQALADAGRPVAAAMVPEFLREGTAVADARRPTRVVIGTRHPRARHRLTALLEPLTAPDRPLLHTDPTSAELAKLAANTTLAMRVAWINELAGLAHATGSDIEAVRDILGADPRIGRHYLRPGPGYGGSCFPKDVPALAAAGRDADRPLALAEATHRSNQAHRQSLVDRVLAALPDGGRLAIWGLSFKAGTDDLRQAPSVQLLDALPDTVAVRAYDPQVGPAQLAAHTDRRSTFATDPVDATRGAHLLVVLTEWPVFAATSLPAVAAAMAGRRVIDARNQLDPSAAAAAGLDYSGMGRLSQTATTKRPSSISRS